MRHSAHVAQAAGYAHLVDGFDHREISFFAFCVCVFCFFWGGFFWKRVLESSLSLSLPLSLSLSLPPSLSLSLNLSPSPFFYRSSQYLQHTDMTQCMFGSAGDEFDQDGSNENAIFFEYLTKVKISIFFFLFLLLWMIDRISKYSKPFFISGILCVHEWR